MGFEDSALCLGVAIALFVVLVFLLVCGGQKEPFVPLNGPRGDLTEQPIDTLMEGGQKQPKSIYDSTNLFLTTDDVDPLITGQGYAFRDYTRDVYTGRTAVGGSGGLQEFASDRSPGMVGVDIGPNALSEYEGSALGWNDGIPEAWKFPSTPIRWYKPAREDYYGHDGPAINNSEKLYPLWEQDNSPLIGADPDPSV
ncbi:MAG: hypothetical protein KGL39_09410 [Patescibacteria group bacterium]|nr:hypothetical protein [Patescibacteria group bacterium]